MNDINREIYNRNYTFEHLRLQRGSLYDKRMVDLRFAYIKEYGTGKDVLEICCGTGSYLIPILGNLKSAVGLDFSSNMLSGFMKALNGKSPSNLNLIEADARNVPLKDESFDFIFSYCSLYYVPNVDIAIKEISRLLRPGGHAAIELGNLFSLNTLVCNIQHKYGWWAKSFHVPYFKLLRYVRANSLIIVRHHAFQILPMYGAPKQIYFLYPLLSPFWKKILGIKIKGKMLDDWISISWPLRYLAFRHLFILKK